MAKAKPGKNSKEIEQIHMLKSINQMLKSSDMENALISNSARDSETVPDAVVDEMLGRISADRERSRAMLDVEKLAGEVSRRTAQRQKPARRSPKRAKPQRNAGARRGKSGGRRRR